jgi:hypothetical protein
MGLYVELCTSENDVKRGKLRQHEGNKRDRKAQNFQSI